MMMLTDGNTKQSFQKDVVEIQYHTWVNLEELEDILARTPARGLSDFGILSELVMTKPECCDIYGFDSPGDVVSLFYTQDSLVSSHQCLPGGVMKSIDLCFRAEVDLGDKQQTIGTLREIESKMISIMPEVRHKETQYVNIHVRKYSGRTAQIDKQKYQRKRTNFEFNGEYYAVEVEEGYIEVRASNSDHRDGEPAVKSMFDFFHLSSLFGGRGNDSDEKSEDNSPKSIGGADVRPKAALIETKFDIGRYLAQIYEFSMQIEDILPKRYTIPGSDVVIFEDAKYIDYELGLLEKEIKKQGRYDGMAGHYIREAKRFMDAMNVSGRRIGEFFDAVNPHLQSLGQQKWKDRHKRRRAGKKDSLDPFSQMIYGKQPTRRKDKAMIPSKEQAWDIILRENRYPKAPEAEFEADSNNWRHIERDGSYIWTYQFPGQVTCEGNLKVMGLHYWRKEDGILSPVMFIFDDMVGVDHWWGGRQRYGHGHKRDFRIFYFDLEGKGDFVAGEFITEKPHYLVNISSQQIPLLNLEKEVRSAMQHHPDKIVSSWYYGSCAVDAAALSDVQLREKGLSSVSLFECYSNPHLVHMIREKVTAARRERVKEVIYDFGSSGRKGEQQAYEPSFSIGDIKDRQEFLFQLLEMSDPSVSYR